ncbi:hypothetical protein WJT74_02350 [Sphingomicrobium sp. XHP0239]|uniref:hypothetical protein n=1 Tax=Sphingomicrobium maritimum TaxID=3133972 RepID=UPI0031CC622A
MSLPFIVDRAALEDATRLIDQHGAAAQLKAAAMAEASRRNENVHLFCHWRQIERVIAALATNVEGATRH